MRYILAMQRIKITPFSQEYYNILYNVINLGLDWNRDGRERLQDNGFIVFLKKNSVKEHTSHLMHNEHCLLWPCASCSASTILGERKRKMVPT